MAREEHRKRTGARKSESPSSDLSSILAATDRIKSRDHVWQAAIDKDPDLVEGMRLAHETEFLAALMSRDWHSAPRRERFLALRILLSRLGKGAARHAIRLANPASPHSHQLVLKPQTVAPEALEQLNREIRDARFITEEHHLRQQGAGSEAAIEAASRKVFGTTRTVEAAKKIRARGRKAAAERGYIDPREPFIRAIEGGPIPEPSVRTDDLSRAGRPKKVPRPN